MRIKMISFTAAGLALEKRLMKALSQISFTVMLRYVFSETSDLNECSIDSVTLLKIVLAHDNSKETIYSVM